MKHFLVLLMLFSAASFATAGGTDDSEPTLWLPIVATEKKVSNALSSMLKLQRCESELIIVETNDCLNLREDLYLVVAGIHESRMAAESMIDEWHRLGVEDAYLRSCQVIVPSRLSLGVQLLDPSFARQETEAVNWELKDAVSLVISLNDQTIALVLPTYEVDLEDIREGLRIGVRIYLTTQRRYLDLSSDCIDPEFSLSTEHIALTCVNESAATYLLHRTQLFSLAGGQVVAEEKRCTNPLFEQERWTCKKESIDADGIMELQPTVLYPR